MLFIKATLRGLQTRIGLAREIERKVILNATNISMEEIPARIVMCKLSFVIFILLLPAPLIAQSDDTYHPILQDDWYLGAGAFFPDKSFTIRVDGTNPGDDIDFQEAFGVDDSETTGAAILRWRFGEKWSVQAQYWKVSDSASAVLDQDLEWEDVIFREGTGVKAGTGLDVTRVFFGRRLSTSSQHEFGLGLGLHWVTLEAYIEGQILTDEEQILFSREKASTDAPLPNIGGWYTYSWAPKWAFTASLDWLSASIGDYSGSLWDAQVGVNWAVTDHFGIGASWNYFNLDVNVKASDWRGSAEVTQSGPFVSLSATC